MVFQLSTSIQIMRMMPQAALDEYNQLKLIPLQVIVNKLSQKSAI